MKKLLLLFFSLLAFGYMFQACDNSKTYAEMLDEEKDAVNAFIKKHNIQTISESDFEANGYKTDTTKNEYVAFSNGVYMQIVDKGIVTDKPENDSIKNNNIVAVRCRARHQGERYHLLQCGASRFRKLSELLYLSGRFPLCG